MYRTKNRLISDRNGIYFLKRLFLLQQAGSADNDYGPANNRNNQHHYSITHYCYSANVAWADDDRNGKQVDVDTSSSDKRISNLKVSSVDNVQVDIRTTITTSSITTVYLETTIT